MEYSEYRFRRIVTEKTKPLEQMASYIHQNTDMKLYLFLTLEDYAEFEAIQKHYYGRIQWVANGAEISQRPIFPTSRKSLVRSRSVYKFSLNSFL